MKKKSGKCYEVIIPFGGVYFDAKRGRREYGGELHKDVTKTFGEALTQDLATLAINIIDETADLVMVEVDGVFVDIGYAEALDSEDDRVHIEIFMEQAVFKSSPETVSRWAHENGWYIAECSDIENVEDIGT